MVGTVAPLRIRRFRTLWVASIVSNVGSFLQAVAASWLMLELTDSAAWVGLMAASSTLPLLFLALAAGAVADMFDRRWVLVLAQTTMGASAAAMSILTILDRITPGVLLALGLLLGIGLAFNLPAWQATVPDLVPRGMVASAVALNSVAFNVARAVGPALGGLILVVSGPGLAFALNAVSYLGVIVVLLVLAREMPTPDREETSMINAIALGVRFARFTPAFRKLLALGAMFAMTSAAVQSILPNRTVELGGGEGAYGILLGAMGLGALGGGFSRQLASRWLGRLTLPLSVGLFGIAGVSLGLVQSIPFATVSLLVAGTTWVWALATLNATAQLMSPEWVRGRAMSLYTLSFVGVLPLGSILAGWIADRIGADTANVILGGAGAAVGFLIAPLLRIPNLDDVETPEFDENRHQPDHVVTVGGPVLITTNWDVDHARLSEFLEVMQEVRLVRLRTGAYRWRLYRDASDPHRLTELFLTVSWEEHLAQHRRIDDASAAILRKARSLDRNGSPGTVHRVAVDIENPANWEALLDAHADYHSHDGSIPLTESGVPDRSIER
ncbi:MAG: MFS transporter [Acidimicrobiia bacterium]|nr:MFS transporter [Acidimicrobiia bacterium]MDX2466644.1 MFS transporter [Acidimicrobiia bacterium]